MREQISTTWPRVIKTWKRFKLWEQFLIHGHNNRLNFLFDIYLHVIARLRISAVHKRYFKVCFKCFNYNNTTLDSSGLHCIEVFFFQFWVVKNKIVIQV